MIESRLLNVSHPVKQRAIDDVLVRVTTTRGDHSTVQYMSRGRAAMALARYPRVGLVSNPGQRFVVELVDQEWAS